MKNSPGRKARREIQFASPSKFMIGMEIVALRQELIKKNKKKNIVTSIKPININDVDSKYTKSCLYEMRAFYKQELKKLEKK